MGEEAASCCCNYRLIDGHYCNGDGLSMQDMVRLRPHYSRLYGWRAVPMIAHSVGHIDGAIYSRFVSFSEV